MMGARVNPLTKKYMDNIQTKIKFVLIWTCPKHKRKSDRCILQNEDTHSVEAERSEKGVGKYKRLVQSG